MSVRRSLEGNGNELVRDGVGMSFLGFGSGGLIRGGDGGREVSKVMTGSRLVEEPRGLARTLASDEAKVGLMAGSGKLSSGGSEGLQP